MATVVRLRVCPESFDYLCFRGHHSRRSLRRGFCWSSSRMILGGGHDGLRLNRCWALKSENGGHLEEKRSESEGEDQILVNLNREKGFWVSMKSIMLKTFKANPKSDDEYRQAVAKVEEVLSSVALQIGRYIVTMMSTGVILTIGFLMSGGESQMEGLIWYSWLGGIIIGTMIGANMVLEEHCRAGPRNVIITGSTRGLGKALAREFLLSGDRVVVTSRSPESVQATVEELEESLKEGIASGVGSSLTKLSHAKVVGIACDVCEPRDVQRLANFAVSELGCIDIWINNAGANKGFRPLLQFSDEDIRQIVSTNLVGSIICTREAIRIMNNQPNGGRIFNMDGAGSGGSSTPLTAVYGSTKCGLRQLQGSLLKECKRSKVGVHSASPGMVLTDLLLSGSTVQNRQMFNIICELPETVARTLVPRMRIVKGTGKAVNYLTPPRILFALITAWLRRGRWFDDQGRALYAAEADRLRNWAENRTRLSITDAMEMYTENTWVSVFSLSVVCAFIILSSTSSSLPGT
ncbi:probable chlorophyll(ide) b reductase NYC1, chloroplastic isoform X1 [Neltuma alba]|uniref:probable chlorophyll(ide) b reductase NYC1, chloroplastic isoform X1 n=1 Tax=Neltuma alba TaxID=207710 RepID=UPI0010A304ED|nr:probable chlorophyll(ide) b reductase NYC1, chloroplastic [Prosopis alba]XP_028806586.1 probable chlorophyll(ide) b reductase NYC1, chloroplastic isoform X1 [Prosopis alba]